MKKPSKTFVCTLSVLNWYQYRIFKIEDSKGEVWYEANPMSLTVPLATKVADTLDELKTLLELDCINHRKIMQKVR